MDLTPGRPDAARLVDPRWREAWRTAASRMAATAPPAAGLAELRAELAAHLRQVRGVLADPADILATTGPATASRSCCGSSRSDGVATSPSPSRTPAIPPCAGCPSGWARGWWRCRSTATGSISPRWAH
ncbi:hypothetical protein G7085_09920 [Tessaracoccus sp. HDW20]|uniref:hypothetical protein n=1 Tax=Tessaracoccus coleopterorum TaxID=2714950 RepID=UPI0018D4C4BC|nr:hypothetical protein [Tessaracoccus coleopterorum]NHB84810.1 hypothetical protein [Tessaracoccus coleopterorum]